MAVTVYLGFAFFSFSQEQTHQVCQRVKVTIADSAYAVFITAPEIYRRLKAGKIDPKGKLMESISCLAIEKELKKSSFIKEVTCYKTGGNDVNIIISQRLPLLRIMAENGEDYYIDERGEVMQPQQYAADLPVATGHITQQFARRHLLPLGQYLLKNAFWNELVEQVIVNEQGELSFVPRVGTQIIRFGKAEQIERKFLYLRTFYEKVMPQVGWNKYSEISVAYTHQIICKKHKEKE